MRGVVGKIVDKYTGNFKIEKKSWKATYFVEVERKQEGWIPKPPYAAMFRGAKMVRCGGSGGK